MADLDCPLCATTMRVDEGQLRELHLSSSEVLEILHKGLDAHLTRFCTGGQKEGRRRSEPVVLHEN